MYDVHVLTCDDAQHFYVHMIQRNSQEFSIMLIAVINFSLPVNSSELLK